MGARRKAVNAERTGLLPEGGRQATAYAPPLPTSRGTKQLR